MGHTIINGVIQSLSVSQMATADTTQFGGCLRKWGWEKIFDKKTKETKQQATGTQCHAELDHYVSTGEDALGRITRAGKRFLPLLGPDLRVEWGLNNMPRPPNDPVTGKQVHHFPGHESLLLAGGIPLIGFIDLINFRGSYVSPAGELLADPAGTVEVIDHKTTSNFKWAKTADQLMGTIQMPGYGEFIRRLVPGIRFVRLSHIYYLTAGAPMARKVTTLVPVEQFPVRWAEIEAGVVVKMKAVAAAKRAEDIQGFSDSCDAFRGCAHRAYCPQSNKTPKSNAMTRLRMSFIKKAIATGKSAAPSTPAAPLAAVPAGIPPPPGIPAPPGASVAAAPSAPPAVTYACMAIQGQPYVVGEVNTIFTCRTDDKFSFVPVVGGTPLLLAPADVIVPGAIPAHASAGLVPPPKPVATTAASDAVAAVGEATTPVKRGRKKATPSAPSAEERAEEAAALGAPLLELYINCMPTVIDGLTMLDPYVAERVAEINKKFDTIDPRVNQGSGDPLGFGAWKAILGEAVRANPPPPGAYVALTYQNELAAAVVDALIPLCSTAVRGVR